jgi:hypothetical protein
MLGGGNGTGVGDGEGDGGDGDEGCWGHEVERGGGIEFRGLKAVT